MKKIGIFDSGVGGLNVLYEAFLRLGEQCEFAYFADHENVPYGQKSSGEIKSLLYQALRFLKLQGCDALVIACNTASSVADREFRAGFGVPIIAMEPAIKPAITHFGEEAKILIAATQATIMGDKLAALLASLGARNCDLMALPRLVNIAQSGDFRAAQGYLQSIGLFKYDAIVLGCTHFNYFKKEMKIANAALSFVDGNFGTIKHLASRLGLELGKNEANLARLVQNTEFFISNLPADSSDMELIKKCLARAKMCRAIR